MRRARRLVRDARRGPSSNDDVAGLEALDYWTHLCDCARRKTDVRLFVSNECLYFRFGCIIEPTGFIMNKHTYVESNRQVANKPFLILSYIILSYTLHSEPTRVSPSPWRSWCRNKRVGFGTL